jgi:hypothetical protein
MVRLLVVLALAGCADSTVKVTVDTGAEDQGDLGGLVDALQVNDQAATDLATVDLTPPDAATAVCLAASTACTSFTQCCSMECGYNIPEKGLHPICCHAYAGDPCATTSDCCNQGAASDVLCSGGKCCHLMNGTYVCQ